MLGFRFSGKSQSALEYLLTYGWAIIILVVVVAAIYALGIFNTIPSAPSISGFAGIQVSGAQANASVLEFNIENNLGIAVNLTGMSIAFGNSSYTVWQCTYAKLYPGQSAICAILGNFSMTRISYQVYLNYAVSSLLTGVSNGTISITPSIQFLSNSFQLHSVAVSVYNNQSTATPNPFQQMITFDPRQFSGYEMSNLGNIRFFYGAQELYSWCESGCSNTANLSVFWVKLTTPIPADSSLYLSMAFEPLTNYDGVYAGEAPNLGEAKVAGYANFSGGYIEQQTGFSWMNNAAQPFSISIWVNPSSSNGVITSEAGQSTVNSGWHDSWIELVSGDVYMRLWGGLGCYNLGPIPDGNWSNIIITYDGNKLTGYINGAQKGTESGTRSVPGGSNQMFYPLGTADGTNCGSGASYSGKMANYQIYNYVLTSSDISSIQSSGQFSSSSASSPQLWYKLFLNSNDSSRTSNNGGQSGSVSIFPDIMYQNYGRYDNGANVFNLYTNFSGVTLPSIFTASGSHNYAVNDSIYLYTSPSGNYNIYSTQDFNVSSGVLLDCGIYITNYSLMTANVNALLWTGFAPGQGGDQYTWKLGMIQTNPTYWYQFENHNSANFRVSYSDSTITLYKQYAVFMDTYDSTSNFFVNGKLSESLYNPTITSRSYWVGFSQQNSVGGETEVCNYLAETSSFPVIPSVSMTNIGNKSVYELPITFYNSQNTSTADPFQQMLTVNSAQYSAYEAPNLDNIQFIYKNGSIVPSWLESGNSNTATNTTYWLRLSSIPADGYVTVYEVFYPLATNIFNNVNTGEAPTLSGAYGQYDDGASVFNYYNDGRSISNFNVVNGGSLSVSSQTNPYGTTSNVITFTGLGSTSNGQNTMAWINSPVSGDNLVMEGWVNMGTNNNALYGVRAPSNTTSTFYRIGYGPGGKAIGINYESGTTDNSLVSAGSRTSGWFWIQAIVSGTTLIGNTYSSNPDSGGNLLYHVSTTNSNLPPTNQYLGINVWSGSTSPGYFYETRVRAYPPNGVMPLVVMGSVSPFYARQITFYNIQNTSTANPYQQMLTVDSSNYTSHEAANLQNVQFTYLNGTVIPSWLESGNSNTANDTVYWLKLDSISSLGSLTIDQVFYPVSKNMLNNVTTGEAPQLSPIYGEYDDGANVFNYYTNFAGTTLPSGWVNGSNSGNTYVVNNGLWLYKNSNSGNYAQINGPTFSSDYGVGSQWYSTTNGGRIILSPTGVNYTYQFAINYQSSSYNLQPYAWNGAPSYFPVTTGSTDSLTPSLLWYNNGTSRIYAYVNGITVGELSSQFTRSSSSKIYLLAGTGGSTTSSAYFQNLFTFSVPPNNVMPIQTKPVKTVAITFYNGQSFAMPSPFEQMLKVNSASYSSYEDSNLQNIVFEYSNGTIVPSWLEYGNSNTATSTVYWLKLGNIPAGGSVTIYEVFYPVGVNLFNNMNTGEAPQLSSTYGQYDDGASVFSTSKYTAFIGTTLPSWLGASTSSYSVNNGLTLGTSTMVFSKNPVGAGYFIGEDMMWANSTHYNFFGVGNTQTGNAQETMLGNTNGNTLVEFQTRNTSSSSTQVEVPNTDISNWNTFELYINSTTPNKVVGYVNFSSPLTLSSDVSQFSNGIYLQLWRGGDAGLGEFYHYILFTNTSYTMPCYTGETCLTTFTETGLPSGISWQVTYNGVANTSSTPNSIGFDISSGSYSYSVSSPSNSTGYCSTVYSPTPSSGTLVTGSTKAISFSMAYISCSSTVTTFTQSGLELYSPNIHNWNVTYDGISNYTSTNSSSMTITPSAAGTYSFSVPTLTGGTTTVIDTCTPSPSSGTLLAGEVQAIKYSCSALVIK